MKTKFVNKKSAESKYSTRHEGHFTINLPVHQIDLYKWVTGMTATDYSSYSKAHLAISSFLKDDKFYMNNVENIGNELLVQHYELIYHTADHVQFYSNITVAYVMR